MLRDDPADPVPGLRVRTLLLVSRRDGGHGLGDLKCPDLRTAAMLSSIVVSSTANLLV